MSFDKINEEDEVQIAEVMLEYIINNKKEIEAKHGSAVYQQLVKENNAIIRKAKLKKINKNNHDRSKED